MVAAEKRGPGRPPRYVQYEGKTIKGLSGPKPPLTSSSGSWADGRYYSTHNDPRTENRVYFGTDLDEAVRAFRRWKWEVDKWKRENK